jgi:hypothetical protein
LPEPVDKEPGDKGPDDKFVLDWLLSLVIIKTSSSKRHRQNRVSLQGYSEPFEQCTGNAVTFAMQPVHSYDVGTKATQAEA